MVEGDRRGAEGIFHIDEAGVSWIEGAQELGLDVLDRIEYLQHGVDRRVDNVDERDCEGVTCQASRGVTVQINIILALNY